MFEYKVSSLLVLICLKAIQESIAKVVLHSKTQLFLVFIYTFYKSATVSSDHDAETRASPPLFRHSDVMAHLIIEQITIMNDPGFQNEC